MNSNIPGKAESYQDGMRVFSSECTSHLGFLLGCFFKYAANRGLSRITRIARIFLLFCGFWAISVVYFGKRNRAEQRSYQNG